MKEVFYLYKFKEWLLDYLLIFFSKYNDYQYKPIILRKCVDDIMVNNINCFYREDRDSTLVAVKIVLFLEHIIDEYYEDENCKYIMKTKLLSDVSLIANKIDYYIKCDKISGFCGDIAFY